MNVVPESDFHIPVMPTESINYLWTQPSGVYVDATMGGGGHSALILEKLSNDGRLYSFDADSAAIEHCQRRFADELGRATCRLQMIQDNFVNMFNHIPSEVEVNGVLFDLGVSSYQFDHHKRGFSFRGDYPLDMRFGNTEVTASDILEHYNEEDLARMFYRYGEEPASARIAAAIVRRRKTFPLRTTFDLRDVITQNVGARTHKKTLRRIFQALRVGVNTELDVLESVLLMVEPRLAHAGRVVVISYHSLEDRIVKRIFRDLNGVLDIITRRPLLPSDAEVEANPRARSARMRVAARI